MSGPGVRRIHAAGLHDGGFSHAAVAPAGDTLFTAGISPLDSSGALDSPGDPVAQTRRCLADLATVLAAAGASPDGLVKLTVYVVTDDHDVLGQVWRIVDEWFAVTPPAIVLGVAALPYRGQRVEVEAIASVHR
ncbi:RidA family protein [Gordonia sp. FQ]|uniref:RidA family protein n=1 Tax=Gordonia sp. FQ TaxID=3446634 RepID=UPI003F857485